MIEAPIEVLLVSWEMSRMKKASRRRVGCSIARLREQKGLKQSELAQRVGIRANTLSEIESGAKLASLTTSLLLAEALRCDVSDMFFLDP